MKKIIIGLFLLTSSSVFGGAKEMKDRNLPNVNLTDGQVVMLEKYLQKQDKSGLTNHLRVEFICSRKKKKKSYLDPTNFNCKLVEIN